MRKATLVLMFLGSTLYWPLLRRNALFYSLAGHDDDALGALGWYAAFLCVTALLVLATCVWRSWTRRLLEDRPFVLVGIACLQAVIKVLEVSLAPEGALGVVVAIVDTALFACMFVMLTYMWASWYVALSARTATLMAIASFGLSFVVKALMFVPGIVGVMLTACVPSASALLWVLGHGDCVSHSLPRQTARPRELARNGLVVMLALFLVAGGIMRGVTTGVVSGEISRPPLTQDVISVIFAILLFVGCLLRPSLRGFYRMLWPIATILFFLGLLLISLVKADGFDFGHQLLVMGRTCLAVFLWIVLVDVARARGFSVVLVFGAVFLLVDALSSLLGYVVMPLAMGALGISAAGATAPLSTIVAFLLIVSSLLFMTRTLDAQALVLEAGAAGLGGQSRLGSGRRSMPGDARTDAQTALQADGQADAQDRHLAMLLDYSLTDREMVVARLLSEGNSQRKIAELLELSVGTVQTHLKNIYRKLGIHSRQEFIDLVHQAK